MGDRPTDGQLDRDTQTDRQTEWEMEESHKTDNFFSRVVCVQRAYGSCLVCDEIGIYACLCLGVLT